MNNRGRKNHRHQYEHAPRPRWQRWGVVFGVLILSLFIVRAAAGSFSALLSPVIAGDFELAQTDGYTHVLLLGIDRRKETLEAGGLNDTIIVASINKSNQVVYLTSLPRDLWVPMGGGYYGKINSAFGYGGIEQVLKTTSQVLGIPIHYYGLVDFEGFVQGVDILGGIDVFVERTFDDYKYPIEGKEAVYPEEDRYEHVHFEQGWVHMDGETALKFARSRHAVGPDGSDFSRAARQQQVLLSAKDKALSLSTLFNPLKIKELYEVFGTSVETDLTVAEAQAFYALARDLSEAQIITEVIDSSEEDGVSLLYTPQDLEPYDNAWVLVPRAGDFSGVQRYMNALLFDREDTY